MTFRLTPAELSGEPPQLHQASHLTVEKQAWGRAPVLLPFQSLSSSA